MDESVPLHYITPKIAFLSDIEDLENHLKAFRAQMIISGGSDTIRCKMLIGTFTGTILQWFSGIPDRYITTFPQFSKMFKEQFSTNKVNPPCLYDMFTVRQSERESLKAYLNKFSAFVARLQTQDDEMVVAAFEQGMIASSLSDSLIRNPAEMLFEVREQATAHIEAEEVVLRKTGNLRSKQPIYKEGNRDRSVISIEASLEKRSDLRYVPYVAKKDKPKTKAREETTIRPKFQISYKEFVKMLEVTNKLKFPQKQIDSWIAKGYMV